MKFDEGVGQRERDIAWRVIRAALEAVDPAEAVRREVHLDRDGNILTVAGAAYDLSEYGRVLVVGGGKAGAPMAGALHEILGDRIDSGAVVVKYGHGPGEGVSTGPVEIIEAGHPIPDEAGLEGAKRIFDLLGGMTGRDLVFCLLSGGGSALMTLPQEGISLPDLQSLTGILLRCGATINEVNSLRKHVSRLKGGSLARRAHPAAVVSLILSDVVGDPLDVIASGPTVPDTTSFEDAWRTLEKYGIVDEVPASIRGHLQKGLAGAIPDTPGEDDPVFGGVQNVVVGSNRLAAEAAVEAACAEGLRAALLTTYMEGEAREVGKVVAALGKSLVRHGEPLELPACLVLGGETTVTLRGSGKGGRNQEMALAAAIALAGWPGLLVVCLATDGTDGPTDAGGAFATGDTLARAARLGLDAEKHLADNDSYAFFERIGDLLLTGPTRTNVNDLVFIFALSEDARDGLKP